MVPPKAERKLAAVLAADVAGYTRLMDTDEDATMATWWSNRQEFIDSNISKSRGRIVKLTGDGFLAEFPSALDAVSAAVEIQTEVARRNIGTRRERRMQYRMGINMCDIMADDEDIYGHGVNVAARLEAMADSGGINISQNVYDQVRHNLELEYESLGEKSLKNIDEPVTVYRVELDFQTASRPAADTAKTSLNWQWPAVTVAVALIAIGGTALWFKTDRGLEQAQPVSETSTEIAALETEESSELPPAREVPSLAVVGKPSIAVLPFSNMTADQQQEYFVDGMTETLITDLSLISGLYVSSRNAVFVYKGQSINIPQVADELGVLYVLEGSVQRDGNKVRINAQLIDADSGGHVWAGRYDGVMDDVFALQDEVTEQIVSALAIKLTDHEARQVVQRETTSVEAYDAFQQGRTLFQNNTPVDFLNAISHLEEARQKDPTYSRPHAVLAAIYQTAWSRGWTENLGISRQESLKNAGQYLESALKAPTPIAHQVASTLHYIAGRFDEAITEAERAIALAPDEAGGHFAMAKALIYAGQADDGIDYLYAAMELEPDYRAEFLVWLGMARFLNENYNKAARSLKNANKSLPNDATALALLAATYGHLGRRADAELALTQLDELEAHAGWTAELLDVDKWPFKEEEDRKRLRDGLVLAGFEGQSQ